MAHPSVSRAIVVGLKDKHYGEVVGAFVEKLENSLQPTDLELRDWVRNTLGKHKSPTHVFWLGQNGVPSDVPLTGSGKVRKFEMAKMGNDILAKRSQTSKL